MSKYKDSLAQDIEILDQIEFFSEDKQSIFKFNFSWIVWTKNNYFLLLPLDPVFSSDVKRGHSSKFDKLILLRDFVCLDQIICKR